MMNLAIALLVAALSAASAQTLNDARRLYDSGKYREAIDTVSSAAPEEARLLYLAAQSHDKLRDGEGAARAYEQLATRSEDDPWHFIGQSALRLRERNANEALASAREAVAK